MSLHTFILKLIPYMGFVDTESDKQSVWQTSSLKTETSDFF